MSVPFGKRKIVGVVIKNIQKPGFLKKVGAIKKIIAVLDEYPLFDKPIFDSILWSSDYYHHPIGEVFNTFVPTELRKINNKKIEALREFSEYSVNEDDKKFDLTKDQEKAVKALSKSKGFSPTLLYGVTGSGKTEVYLRVAETFIKNNKSVLVLFVSLSIFGGALMTGQVTVAMYGFVAVGLIQIFAWFISDSSFSKSGTTIETATGLGNIGKVRMFEPPHTGTNYLLKEMVYVIGRKHAAKLRLIAIILMIVIPILMIGMGAQHGIKAIIAVLSHVVGVFASRWLFFAQAEHVVGLYYGKRG